VNDDRRTRATVFGEIAELYERRRPGYPAWLFGELIAAAGGPGAVRRALEAGAGTGKATADLARRGVRVDAVEPSAAMAEIARSVCAGLPVELHVQPFEAWEGPAGAYDLVASAQAWHWIDHDRGLEIARRALRPGGALAVWWNLPGRRDERTRDAIDAAYAEWAPELGRESTLHRSDARRIDPATLLADGFDEPHVRSHTWTAAYDATAYTELLQTHSDHRILPPDQRAGLLAAVAAAIDATGAGEVVVTYQTDLATIRRA
jgi:SAM-dependent methyltransferase